MTYGLAYGLGLSADAIAGSGTYHPHDPSDLLRCINYCEMRHIDTEELHKRMSGRSVYWDRLLSEWDNLTALLKQEIKTRTDDQAPETFKAMQRVLAGGVKCVECDGTGRGGDCPKCKGTGRRCGGRCLAPQCHQGSAICAACRGRGFSTREAKA